MARKKTCCLGTSFWPSGGSWNRPFVSTYVSFFCHIAHWYTQCWKIYPMNHLDLFARKSLLSTCSVNSKHHFEIQQPLSNRSAECWKSVTIFFPKLKISMTTWKLCYCCGWIWALTRGKVRIKSHYNTDVFLQFIVRQHYSWANLVKADNTEAETLNLLSDLLQPIVYPWAHYSASFPIFILCLHNLFRLKNLWAKNFPTVFAKVIWSHLSP